MDMLKRYADFAPTAFDCNGLGADRMGDDGEGRGEWVVGPVSQTRGSGPLELSNFRSVLADIGGEGEDVEVHRFGHWGPGWFEIILARPGTEAAGKLTEWAERLADYPVADEEDFSELESEDEAESWDAWGRRDWARAVQDVWNADYDKVTDEEWDALWGEAGGECEHGGDGPHFLFERAVRRLTAEQVRRILVNVKRADGDA